MQHVFIVGAKGFTYGGYETFLDKLTEYHQDNENIKYHIACKANGPGMTDETKLAGAKRISDSEYVYHNAHCFKIKSPELGSAQAIFYDIKAIMEDWEDTLIPIVADMEITRTNWAEKVEV